MDHPTRRGFVCAAGSAALIGAGPARAQGALEVLVSGSGPRVVLVHGSISNGRMTWSEQQPLAGVEQERPELE